MPVGEVVASRYELVEQIGSGGQALVYRARDRQTNAFVALKMLAVEGNKDPNAVERMAREQQAMVKLAGTSAVGFVDLCTAASGAVCLVMELLEGETLEAKLGALEDRGERLSVDEMAQIMRPIVDTLDKAHAVGIVHRDLKPGNIFLAEPGPSPRLLDFGLSRLQSSAQLTALGQVLGSPSYIAPEMWTGRSEDVDYRADIYSLGVILFRILTGRVPFEGTDLRQKLVQTTTAERPSLHALRPDLPARVDAWVRRVLAIERDKRFDSARVAFEALRQAVGLPGERREEDPEESSAAASVRQWLATPLGGLPNSLTTAWNKAAGMLGKLTRSVAPQAGAKPEPKSSDVGNQATVLASNANAGPSKMPNVPPPPPPVGGPPRAKRDETSILDLADILDEESVVTKPERTPLPPRPEPPTMLFIKNQHEEAPSPTTLSSATVAEPLPPRPEPPTLLFVKKGPQQEPASGKGQSAKPGDPAPKKKVGKAKSTRKKTAEKAKAQAQPSKKKAKKTSKKKATKKKAARKKR